MDYSVLNNNTTKEDRKLIDDFLSLPPQKILLFTSAILSGYISTFSSPETRDDLIKAIFDNIKKEVERKTIVMICMNCGESFITYEENAGDPRPICSNCSVE